MGIVVSDGRIFENGVFHEAKETKVESADAPKDEQKVEVSDEAPKDEDDGTDEGIGEKPADEGKDNEPTSDEQKVESADAPKDEQKNDSDAEKPANKGGKGKKKPFVVIDGSQITPEEKK